MHHTDDRHGPHRRGGPPRLPPRERRHDDTRSATGRASIATARLWLEWIALAATVPAFYLAMFPDGRALATVLYGAAASACAVSLAWDVRHVVGRSRDEARGRRRPRLLLIAALVVSALVPAGDSIGLLILRLTTSLLAMLRVLESIDPWFWRRDLPRYLALAVAVFVACGLGFWALEPRVDGLGDGLWLAFTTAATVGYGDIVPSTPASRIFAVFVVLLGVAVLSLVTAAIAAMWVQSEDRKIEADLLTNLDRRLDAIHADLRRLQDRIDRT